MKLSAFRSTDPELSKFVTVLRQVLSHLSVDNFQVQVVEGTTSGIAHTKRTFRHGLVAAPRMWLPLEGDFYIASGGLGTKEIDVRSAQIAATFKLLLIK